MIDYKYFMDELQEYEVQLLCEIIPWGSKISMEQTRMLMYSITAPYMKHKKKLTEFFPLYTDEERTKGEKLEGDNLNVAREMVQKAFNFSSGMKKKDE